MDERRKPSTEEAATENPPEKSASQYSRKKFNSDEALKNFEQNEIPQPKKRKYGWLGYILLLVVVGVGIWLMFSMAEYMGDGQIQSLHSVIANSDWKFAIITFVVLLLIIIFDAMKYCVVMQSIDGKFRLRTGLKVMFLGKYYDNVTPFATGGQAMQIYYLHKKGFSGGTSSAVVFIKYFANNFVWLALSLVLMAANSDVLLMLPASTANLMKVAGWIGWSVSMLLPAFVIIFAVVPKFAYKLTAGVIGLGKKLRIVKDKEKALQKAIKTVDDFRAGFVIMSRHPFKFILLILFCFLEVALAYSFPYFLMRTFSGLTASDGFGALIDVMTLNLYASFSVAIIPTPGNSGFLEGAVTAAFSKIAGVVLFWVVFAWRFLQYYIYILIGIGITVFEFIRKIVRARRAKKQAANAETPQENASEPVQQAKPDKQE